MSEQPGQIPWQEDKFGSLPVLQDTLEPGNLGAVRPNFLETIRILKNAFCNLPEGIDINFARELQKRIEVSIIADILRIGGMTINEVPQAATYFEVMTASGIPVDSLTSFSRGEWERSTWDMTAAGLPEVLMFSKHSLKYENEESIKEAMVKGVVIDISLMSKGVGWGFGKMLSTLQTLESEGKISEADIIRIINENYGFAALRRDDNGLECGISIHILDKINSLLNHEEVNIIISVTDDMINTGESFASVINEIMVNLKKHNLTQDALDNIISRIQLLIPNSRNHRFEISRDQKNYIWAVDTGPANNPKTNIITIPRQ